MAGRFVSEKVFASKVCGVTRAMVLHEYFQSEGTRQKSTLSSPMSVGRVEQWWYGASRLYGRTGWQKAINLPKWNRDSPEWYQEGAAQDRKGAPATA